MLDDTTCGMRRRCLYCGISQRRERPFSLAFIITTSLPSQKNRRAMPVLISSAFDSGNIAVTDITESDKSVRAVLAIVKEPFTHGTDKKQHSQW